MTDATRPLTIYVRLWAIANLLRIHVGYAASTACVAASSTGFVALRRS